ncbi:MAG: hypothetical protein ACRC10_06305 [Thermoguttaceae bacterium]
MNPTMWIPFLFLVILAVSGLVWTYAVFFKPYYLLALSRQVKRMSSVLWWYAYQCTDEVVAERLFAISEEIDQYGDYILEQRFSPNEWEWCLQRITALDAMNVNKPLCRTQDEIMTDLGQAAVIYFMLSSFAIRHPFANAFMIANVRVYRFFRHYLKAIKETISADYSVTHNVKHV